jgi:hypothetical protein
MASPGTLWPSSVWTGSWKKSETMDLIPEENDSGVLEMKMSSYISLRLSLGHDAFR